MTLNRRTFLSASAGLAMSPALFTRRAAAAPLPRDADVVVIGAGAAGIAAARRIMAANRKVIVVEAAGQDGHARAEVGHVVDQVRRQDDHHLLADLGRPGHRREGDGWHRAGQLGRCQASAPAASAPIVVSGP